MTHPTLPAGSVAEKAALAGGAALADFEVRASAAAQQLSAAGAANGIEDLVGAPA